MSQQLYETNDIWIATAICYAWGTEALAKITDTELDNRRRATIYSLAVAAEEAETIHRDYTEGQLGLTDARSFVGAFNSISQRQKAMRLRGDIEWCSPDWVAGRVG